METQTGNSVSSESELLILVDPDDREAGNLSKAECHDGDGILHRAFSLFLFNNQGELLLQQRGAEKRLWPMYWSNTCCSHPRQGESMQVATERRLQQELNTAAALEFIYKFEYQARFGNLGSENELCWVHLGRVEREATARIHFADSMEFAVDLNEKQYADLHDGRRVTGLAYLPKDEFIIEKVGRSNQRQFQDLGIEYYRYVS